MSSTQLTKCMICGGQTVERFSKAFQGEDVHYFACLTCNHLTAGDIKIDPSYERGSYFKEIDIGWEGRNTKNLGYVEFISRLPAIRWSAQTAVLDFGCGIGRLVADLNRAGFNAYGFEPFSGLPAATDRIFTDWSKTCRMRGRVGLVTCIEVLEHLRNPDEVLSEISDLLVAGGHLLVSTGMYKRRAHDKDWYYLNPAAGHVSIFTEESLEILLQRHRFEPVFRINNSVWLFRSVANSRRSIIERTYFAISELRVRSGFRLNFRNAPRY